MKKSDGKQYGKAFCSANQEFLNSLVVGETIKVGERLRLVARSTKAYESMSPLGRRFAYVGVDNVVHVSRLGKPFKVSPMKP